MVILKINVDGSTEVKDIPNELSALQAEVGGYIEEVRIFADDDIAVIVNEEGLILGLEPNKALAGIYGAILIVGVDGEEFCSLPKDKLNALLRIFEKNNMKEGRKK